MNTDPDPAQLNHQIDFKASFKYIKKIGLKPFTKPTKAKQFRAIFWGFCETFLCNNLQSNLHVNYQKIETWTFPQEKGLHEK